MFDPFSAEPARRLMMFDEQRRRMVGEQLIARGIADQRVLAACLKVPRHHFVPLELQADAYADRALPIGAEQTISQPYMVALMLSRLKLLGHERVLEVGTGSGYQAALLAQLASAVWSVERLPELAEAARKRLGMLGCRNVEVVVGDGSIGWLPSAPFDAVVVAAASPGVPAPLEDQLAEGGRMVIPVGAGQTQVLMELVKRQGIVRQLPVVECVFVPLIGRHGWPEEIA